VAADAVDWSFSHLATLGEWTSVPFGLKAVWILQPLRTRCGYLHILVTVLSEKQPQYRLVRKMCGP